MDLLLAEEERRAERRRRIEESDQQEQQLKAEWKSAVSEIYSRFDVDSFLRFGEILRSQQAEQCLNWFVVDGARWWHLMTLTKSNTEQEHQTKIYGIQIVKLLRDAIRNNAKNLEDALQAIEESPVCFNTQRALKSALGDPCQQLWDWTHGRIDVSTPPMSQAELVRSCGGRLEGFSKSKVSKKVANGQIFTTRPVEQLDHRWLRFGHRDPEIRAEMVRLAVEYLVSSKDVVPRQSPAAQLWEP